MTDELKQPIVPTPSQFVTESQVRDIIKQELNNMTGVQRVQSGQIQSQNFVAGSAGWQIQSNGNVEFNTGTFRGDLLIGSVTDSSISIDASQGTINLRWNDVITGTISGVQTPYNSETIFMSLTASSGRALHLAQSGVYCDGTFYPISDIGDSLGTPGTRWNEVWAKTLIAWGSGSKFSCRGYDGIDVGFDTADGKRASFKGGILYSVS